jgi:hypothetical protein
VIGGGRAIVAWTQRIDHVDSAAVAIDPSSDDWQTPVVPRARRVGAPHRGGDPRDPRPWCEVCAWSGLRALSETNLEPWPRSVTLPTVRIAGNPSATLAGSQATTQRRLSVGYAALLVASYVYVAQPGGPVWIAGAEAPWLVGDAILIGLMLRGSRRAIAICGAFDAMALLALAVAEPLQAQPGFVAAAGLLVARLTVLLVIWNRRLRPTTS